MGHRIHRVVWLAILVAVVSVSCADTTSEPRAVPSELQTIDEFMGWAEVDEDASQAFIDLRHRIEGMLVECMADQGLEYAPRQADPGARPLLGEGLSDREFMLRYGYGVFTGMLDEARWNSEYPPDEIGADPDSLWGAFTDDVESYMIVLEECNDQVEEELGRPEPGLREGLRASIEEAWAPLEPELEEMQRSIEDDSRFGEAQRGWSACMDEQGYGFRSDEDIGNHLMNKVGEFEEEANLGTLVLTATFERDIQPFIEEELAIAAADLACRAELDEVREELQCEYEGLFIDEHRDRLEEIRELEHQFTEIILEGWQW